ncbi:MAG: hypothetical protein RR203_02460 [Synergistaceae bacterium]
MALVSGFLKQKCIWTKRSNEFDAFGQPVSVPPVEIKCRWEIKSGFVRGIMGDGTSRSEALSVQHKVTVDKAVSEGDTLMYQDTETGVELGGRVRSVENVVDAGGREQGRTCYV